MFCVWCTSKSKSSQQKLQKQTLEASDRGSHQTEWRNAFSHFTTKLYGFESTVYLRKKDSGPMTKCASGEQTNCFTWLESLLLQKHNIWHNSQSTVVLIYSVSWHTVELANVSIWKPCLTCSFSLMFCNNQLYLFSPMCLYISWWILTHFNNVCWLTDLFEGCV